MQPVTVAGAYQTAFGAFADKGLRGLAVEAVQGAMAEAGVEPGEVEAFYLGNFAAPSFAGQNHLAPYVAGAAGLDGIPATRFEAACASSGSAFFHAVQAVAAGVYRTVVVAGVEVMTTKPTPVVGEILAAAGDARLEGAAGVTFPAVFAMIARRHMHQFGTTREQMAAVAVKNHANGAKNPKAHMKKPITIEQALAGKPVADPLTVYDCSLVSDGAAAVVLTSKPGAVRVRGVAQASDRVALQDKEDITTFRANRLAAAKAYAMAGASARDIEVAELHDCFTIAEIVAMEDLGFCERGRGGPYVLSGATCANGERPVNLSGGLKSKGHPVGATGVAQIVALKGFLESRELTLGLAQNLGGSGATSVVTILERTH